MVKTCRQLSIESRIASRNCYVRMEKIPSYKLISEINKWKLFVRLKRTNVGNISARQTLNEGVPQMFTKVPIVSRNCRVVLKKMSQDILSSTINNNL